LFNRRGSVLLSPAPVSFSHLLLRGNTVPPSDPCHLFSNHSNTSNKLAFDLGTTLPNNNGRRQERAGGGKNERLGPPLGASLPRPLPSARGPSREVLSNGPPLRDLGRPVRSPPIPGTHPPLKNYTETEREGNPSQRRTYPARHQSAGARKVTSWSSPHPRRATRRDEKRPPRQPSGRSILTLPLSVLGYPSPPSSGSRKGKPSGRASTRQDFSSSVGWSV